MKVYLTVLSVAFLVLAHNAIADDADDAEEIFGDLGDSQSLDGMDEFEDASAPAALTKGRLSLADLSQFDSWEPSDTVYTIPDTPDMHELYLTADTLASKELASGKGRVAKKAREAGEKGDHAEAERLFREAINEGDPAAHCLVGLGNAILNQVFVQLRDPTAMANEDTYPAAFHRLHEAIRCYNGAQERAVDNRLESKAETIQRAKDNIRQARKVLNEIFSDLCKHPNKPCAPFHGESEPASEKFSSKEVFAEEETSFEKNFDEDDPEIIALDRGRGATRWTT